MAYENLNDRPEHPASFTYENERATTRVTLAFSRWEDRFDAYRPQLARLDGAALRLAPSDARNRIDVEHPWARDRTGEDVLIARYDLSDVTWVYSDSIRSRFTAWLTSVRFRTETLDLPVEAPADPRDTLVYERWLPPKPEFPELPCKIDIFVNSDTRKESIA